MDTLDLIVIAVAVVAAVGGYRLGFFGRVASWLGLALGFYVAIRLLPGSIRLTGSSPGTQLAVAVLVLVGGAVIGQALGLVVGSRLHRALPGGPVQQVDRVVGAGIGIVGVVAALWLLLPSIAAVPGWPARATASSGDLAMGVGEPPEPTERPAGVAALDRAGCAPGVRGASSRRPCRGPAGRQPPLHRGHPGGRGLDRQGAPRIGRRARAKAKILGRHKRSGAVLSILGACGSARTQLQAPMSFAAIRGRTADQ